MARWVIADDREAEESSSSDEEQDLEEEESSGSESGDEGDAAAADAAATGPAVAPSPAGTIKQRKLSIKLGGPDVCHVCGQRGHVAGFVGAKYLDCPNKPCYLCGKQGHSTMTCPHRIAPGHGCTAAAGVSSDGVLAALRRRERGGRAPPPPAPAAPRWRVEGAVLKLHSRRTTCLEFHPTLDHLVLSGDKRGQVAVWDHARVYERTVYSMNRWLTNALRFMPGGDSCACSSYDGTVKVFDVETGCATTLFDANPQGWDAVEEAEAANNWVTMMGLDVVQSAGAIAAGDSFGRLHLLDARARQPVASLQLHKKNKIQCVHANPADANLLLAAGNDYVARVLDIRALTSGIAPEAKGKAPAGASVPGDRSVLAMLQHSKVINAAYFSPVTGRKILTTCQDNRLRVWDYLYTSNQPADREIVHSQNFNRYLTPFKAEWDPKDLAERLVVCGRYISEDFGGLALHPVDLLDAATGALVGELTDPNLTTICPVNKPHPRLDLIVSGSSRSLYAWRPVPEEEDEAGGSARDRQGGASGHGGGDGGDGPPPGFKGSTFVFFDADPDEKKKGKGRGKAAAAAAASPATASPPSGGKAKAAGRGRGAQGVPAPVPAAPGRGQPSAQPQGVWAALLAGPSSSGAGRGKGKASAGAASAAPPPPTPAAQPPAAQQQQQQQQPGGASQQAPPQSDDDDDFVPAPRRPKRGVGSKQRGGGSGGDAKRPRKGDGGAS